MSKGSAPSAPDPYSTAAAQYQYGTQAAAYGQQLNDVNTSGPTGSTNYQQTGVGSSGAPIMTQTTTLSPQEQQILGQSQGLQSGALGLGGTVLANAQSAQAPAPNIAPVQYNVPTLRTESSIDTSGVPQIANVSNLEQQGQSTALAGEMAALQPSQNAQLEQTKAMLINSGNPPGSPAYESAMSQLNAQLGSQDTQAAGAAITAGTGLQNTNYGESANTNQQLFSQAQAQQQAYNASQGQAFSQNLSGAQLNNSAGQTELSDWAQQTGVPLNELQSILGGSQVSAPTAVSPTSQSVSAPDIMSAFQNQYAGELSNYNAGVASNNALIGDASTLAALGYMASYLAPAAAAA
jgi:hypothetical protein